MELRTLTEEAVMDESDFTDFIYAAVAQLLERGLEAPGVSG